MDDKEEGEISESNDNSFDLDYKPTLRPDVSQYRPAPRHAPSSDEEYNSSDSDSDTPCFAKRKRPNNMRMDVSGPQIENGKSRADRDAPSEAVQTFVKPKKRNNIWASVMQEQVLNQEISGFGLKKRLDHGDRSVESYDYREALKIRGIIPREEGEDSDSEEEDDEMRAKRASRKRPVRDRLHTPKPDIAPVELETLELDETLSDQEYGQAIANALFEEKPEIIIRVVETLGRKLSIDLYNKTKTIEQGGGLMIMNGMRRRTSGGVYLQLLKKEDVSSEDMQKIFPPEDSDNNWRKRKRAHRKRERHESKPQGEVLDDGSGGGVLSGLFPDEAEGVKCPGSTPVTTPQHSDNEEQTTSPINQLDDTDLIKVTSPPRSSHTSPVHPQSTVLDPRAMDPRAMDPRAMDPRAMDPRAMDPRAREQTKYEDDFLDMNADEMDMF